MKESQIVYFDNAATTPIDARVVESMLPYFSGNFGNPSSIHAEGRKAKNAIEKSRKTIASIFNAAPSEVFFTSGGTESDNTALISSVYTNSIKNIITSPIEHHAVLHTAQWLENSGKVKVHYVHIDENGNIDFQHLEQLLKLYPHSLVSLMHANNELGNLYDISSIAQVCKEYQCIYHSDTVQTIGHHSFDLQSLDLDFLVGSAHKFHGPKGIGFLYINSKTKINPFLHGGAQERNMRGGTENVYGIIGMTKALEIAYEELDKNEAHILELKKHAIQELTKYVQGIEFNGASADIQKSLNTVINMSIPESDDNDMLLFNLDIKNIAVSGGSACSSGTDIGSHVLKYIKANPRRGHIRLSLSRANTKTELDYFIKSLIQILEK
jgi:cysteine desulfurase